MLKRSISTGQLTTLIQTEVDALEGELDQQRKLAAEPNAPPPRANDLLNKSFEEVLRDQYSFIENDEDYAAQILGVADDGDRVEEGRQSVTPTKTAATKGHVEKTVQEAKETRKEREAVAELLRVLKAGEVLPVVGDNKAKEAKVEHSYFVGWLQKARIFCRLDRAVQQQPQASNDIFDDLLAAETLDYGKEALGYYQKCISLLPHLAGLTASDLKQAKVYLFSELGQYYQSKGMHRKALQVAVTLLSENRHSQEMQKMLRDSVTVLRETADANQAVFIISTISKLKSPIDACVDFISATYMQIEPLLQRSYDPMFIQARISIVNWYKLLLSEARVKRQCSKPLSVSLRLSSGIRNEGVKVVDHTQESLMMDLLLGYREHDQSPEVREAAKLAIEQVAEFTLDIIEEGYEHVQAGTEEAEGHVISIQVHMESLVQRCSYFQTMLSLNMVEKQTQRMRVVTSQPYVFLDMIDYLYHSEVEFESFDHALAVYMVANQYRVDELKELASSFLSTNAKSYAAEIEDDWAKFKEVYYLADAMNLPNLKTALTQHLTANARWLNNGATLPPFGTDMQRWREVECHFPEVFACVSNDGLIRKIQSAVKHDQLSIAEFFVDLLTKRKREPMPWHSATPFEPEAESQVESSAATVDAQGICSECRIMMGHLTTCSMFKNFRNIAGRARPTAPVAPPPPAVSGAASASQSTAMGGFVPESLLLSLLEKAHSVAWNDLMLKLLRSNFCAITPSVLVKPAEANDVVLLDQLLDILTAVYAEEDAETPGDADGDDDEVSKEKGKEKLRDREEVVPAKEESPRRREGKWQWEGDSSDWHDYDETANQLIEAAYSSGAVMITLTHGWFAGRCGFMIDLNRQKQRNNETNFERNIRRHELLPAAAAPLSHPQELKRQLAVLMNGPVHNGKTLLITFIEKRIPLSITKRFLDLGKSVIDVNVRASLESGESVTALALAIQSVAEARDEARNEPTADELVSRLLALGADPNLPFTVTSLLGMKPSTPLLQAIKQNNFELVQQLVSAGADVSFNVSTSRPLLSLIGADRGPVATLYSPEEDLLASLNSHADRNPLFAACFGREESEDSVRIVRLLLEKGAAGSPPDNHVTPAAAAAAGPRSTGSRSRTLAPPPALVLPPAASSSSGSGTSATTSQALDASVVRGNTPLMAAAFYGRADLVQLLLDVGSADQTAAAKAKEAKGKGTESDDDSSPRPQSACPSVPRACDVGARNWWHWSPLHFAVSAGHEEVVRLLCQAPGAIDSACVVSSHGIVNTARQMAADRQFNRVLSLICALPEDPVVPSLTSSQGSGGGESRSSGTFQHSAELAPLQTFTSVSALGGGATATAVSTLSGSGAAKPRRRLWDRLKFL